LISKRVQADRAAVFPACCIHSVPAARVASGKCCAAAGFPLVIS